MSPSLAEHDTTRQTRVRGLTLQHTRSVPEAAVRPTAFRPEADCRRSSISAASGRSHPVRQDSSFAEKQESHPAFRPPVRGRSGLAVARDFGRSCQSSRERGRWGKRRRRAIGQRLCVGAFASRGLSLPGLGWRVTFGVLAGRLATV